MTPLRTHLSERTVDLNGCARCHGAGHEALTFKPLTHPFEAEPGVAAYTFTHWALCPTNGEPILMRISDKPPVTYMTVTVDGLEFPDPTDDMGFAQDQLDHERRQ